jgi:hypothetical protein
MEGFYAQIGNPVLKNMHITYLNTTLEPGGTHTGNSRAVGLSHMQTVLCTIYTATSTADWRW